MVSKIKGDDPSTDKDNIDAYREGSPTIKRKMGTLVRSSARKRGKFLSNVDVLKFLQSTIPSTFRVEDYTEKYVIPFKDFLLSKPDYLPCENLIIDCQEYRALYTAYFSVD